MANHAYNEATKALLLSALRFLSYSRSFKHKPPFLSSPRMCGESELRKVL